MKFVILTEEEYKIFSENHEQANFLQSIEVGYLRKSNGIRIHFLGVYNEKNEVICASLIEESKIMFKKSFYAPRGFLIDYENTELLTFFTEAVKTYLKKMGGFRLIIDPNVLYALRDTNGEVINIVGDKVIENLKSLNYKHFGFNKFLEAMQVRFAYRLYLDKEYEKIKFDFSKTTRKNIDNCYKKGLSVRIGNENDLDKMENLFESTATRKDFSYRSLNYYKNMYKYMSSLMTIYFAYLDSDKYLNAALELLDQERKNNLEIINKMNNNMVGNKLINQKETSDKMLEKYSLEVEKATKFKKDYPVGLDVAAMLSMKNGSEYLTLSSGGLEEYHFLTPKYMLYDRHIQDAYKLGYKSCNFYGIAGEFKKENNPMYGVYEFKKGFNGNVIEYIGQFTLSLSFFDKVYNVLKKIKK